MPADNNNFSERRSFPRLATSVEVEYTILKEDYSLQRDSITRDISAGGICLIVYEKIEPGTLLSLTLRLPDRDLFILAKGRVIWSHYFTLEPDARDRYDLGIEFIQISETDRQKLSQYVFKLS